MIDYTKETEKKSSNEFLNQIAECISFHTKLEKPIDFKFIDKIIDIIIKKDNLEKYLDKLPNRKYINGFTLNQQGYIPENLYEKNKIHIFGLDNYENIFYHYLFIYLFIYNEINFKRRRVL